MFKGYIYRKWSAFIHRHGYHYAPAQPMPEPHKSKMGIDGNPIIEQMHRCHWCGLRGATIMPNLNKRKEK